MKLPIKILTSLCVATLLIFPQICFGCAVSADYYKWQLTAPNGDAYGRTFFHPREASQDISKRMMGVADKIHLADKDCEWYGTLSCTIGYERSRNRNGLGRYFSFVPCGPINFSADTTQPTPTTAPAATVAADSFSNARSIDWGLAPAYNSHLTFHPFIDKIIADFDLFVGFDRYINKFWGRISAPLVWVRNKLDPREEGINADTSNYRAGFIQNTTNPVAIGYSNAITAWNKLGRYGVEVVAQNAQTGDVQQSYNGAIFEGSECRFRLGEVDLELGYDFVRTQCARFGFYLHGVIPGGNRPDTSDLFHPVAGCYNFQLGVGCTGGWTLWNKNDTNSLTLYGEMLVTHMFKRNHDRIFGLNVGNSVAGNSWILLKSFNPSSGVYANNIYRAVDTLTRSVSVGNTAMTDMALMLSYQRCSLTFSLGYNFWYRSKDDCKLRCNKLHTPQTIDAEHPASRYAPSYFAPQTLGIKGVAPVGDGNGAHLDTFYKKSVSNISTSGGTAVNASNPLTATASDFVLESDIVYDVALAPSAYSNKVFGYIGYTWNDDNDGFTPYVGIAGMYEWGKKNVALTQFGIYLKCGCSL
jgi:hypothetical protein